MSPPLQRHGWEIAFQPQLFARKYSELKAEVKRLKQDLEPASFARHPQVMLLAAVMEGIKERIPVDPYASRFALSGPMRRYGCLKGLVLPDRYRLFLRPFEAEGRRLLLILWLGYPRKDGDLNDCYAVFLALCAADNSLKIGKACSASLIPVRDDPRIKPSSGRHFPDLAPDIQADRRR